jgi:hypothetical protein
MATRENRMADVEHVIARLVVEAVAIPANAAQRLPLSRLPRI